ncbi:hypothetical protein [Acinetobacter dispersus]|uniref:hypothetical protein n=1 Tax=Acinetobacter dispersus TaxID=70348 RepID=UPI001F4BC28A|nr:hypothetical protein [Acinetobacter dispersus]MCH7389544.1 hypothetical protein [Acinetobacter dispersus]
MSKEKLIEAIESEMGNKGIVRYEINGTSLKFITKKGYAPTAQRFIEELGGKFEGEVMGGFSEEED